jgi:aspartyl aminopeptidase
LNGRVQDFRDLLDFLDSSPSPWHAAASTATRLHAAGFAELAETERWSQLPTAGFVRRGGAVVAWRLADGSPTGIRIVGAHTDSPGLRVQPNPDQRVANWRLLGVEVYGGVLLNSWLDRDLGIAGRVVATDGTSTLVHVSEPLARVPQLAIHLDRDVNDRGLVLDRHAQLRPVWATDSSRDVDFAAWLGERAGVAPAFWELCLYDLQPAAVLGADRSLIASGRLDNQVSCWAATGALTAAKPGPHIAVAALFDHEEVGSESRSGASGPLLGDVVDRILAGSGFDAVDDVRRIIAASSCVSADNAHAIHPNYPERHDPGHAPLVNHGPAIKLNANQRYATNAETAALFQSCCEKAGVPVQTFVSRNNIPCGSTIGPLTATRLGIATVDVGVPQLSMHSARELCGAADPGHLVAALGAYWS